MDFIALLIFPNEVNFQKYNSFLIWRIDQNYKGSLEQSVHLRATHSILQIESSY